MRIGSQEWRRRADKKVFRYGKKKSGKDEQCDQKWQQQKVEK